MASAPLPHPHALQKESPPIDKIVLHVDAARGDTVSGVGYVLEGEVSLSGRRPFYGTYTSMEAEYLALAEGLRIASVESESCECIEAYSDAKPLVSKMYGSESCSDDWREYKATFDWLSGKFDNFNLQYKSREHNEKAHEKAREALYEGRESGPD